MSLSALAAELESDDSNTGRVLQDAAGSVVALNSAAERFLGQCATDLRDIGSKPLFAVIDPGGHRVHPSEHSAARALATGAPVKGYIVGVRRPNGESGPWQIWLDAESEPVRDPAENLIGVVSTFTQVNDARTAELQRWEAERAGRLLIEKSTSMVALHLTDTTFTWVSAAAQSLLGYLPEELVGTCGLDLIGQADRAVVYEAMGRASSGQSQAAVFRARHADGHWVWVETVGQVTVDRTTKQVQVQTITRDVSERVAAEQERDAALAQFQGTVKNAPIGMAVLGPDGHWIQVNDAICVLTGYRESELIGGTFRDLTLPEDPESTDDAFAALAEGDLDTAETELRLRRADGTTVWVRRAAGAVRDADGKLSSIVVQLQDITAHKDSQAKLARRALSDPLTGLPNRLVLLDRLTHALTVADRDCSTVGVLFLDLDNFKAINDTCGHNAGDELLRQLAQRLIHITREGDTVARLGGDEFVVIFEQVTDVAHAHTLAERIKTAFDEPFAVGSELLRLSTSIGLALGHQPPAEDLLREADRSMYRAKRGGRGRIDVSGSGGKRAAVDQLVLARDLRTAMDQGQLSLVYQPIVALADQAVIGREALLRWAHPDRGLLLPEAFLTAAEGGQLVNELGAWVLRQACSDAAGWSDQAQVSVNVSPHHLPHSRFADLVRGELESSGLPPQRLCLEITETAVLSASRSTCQATAALEKMGVALALDDFGTRQASITALHRLPIGALKIDQSFVADLPTGFVAQKLVHGLIHLGIGMDINVIAEGVETQAQADWLRAHGCPQGQGNLFGRPAPVTELLGPSSDHLARAMVDR